MTIDLQCSATIDPGQQIRKRTNKHEIQPITRFEGGNNCKCAEPNSIRKPSKTPLWRRATEGGAADVHLKQRYRALQSIYTEHNRTCPV